MNKKINELTLKIQSIENEKLRTIDALNQEYFKIFEDSSELKELLKKLENGKADYFEESFDGVYACMHPTDIVETFNHENEFMRDAFQTYLEEYHCFHLDESNAIRNYYGPCIIIDYSNDRVFDQEKGEEIFSISDICPNERDEGMIRHKINEYQEGQGLFNGVFELHEEALLSFSMSESQKVDDVISMISDYPCSINYGLAPNPNGFTLVFEGEDDEKFFQYEETILSILNSLDSKQVKEFREKYY